jgi:hypothetical protein
MKSAAKRVRRPCTVATPVFCTASGLYTEPRNLFRALKDVLVWSDPKFRGHERSLTKKERSEKQTKPMTLESRLRGVPVPHRPKPEAILKAGKALPDVFVCMT